MPKRRKSLKSTGDKEVVGSNDWYDDRKYIGENIVSPPTNTAAKQNPFLKRNPSSKRKRSKHSSKSNKKLSNQTSLELCNELCDNLSNENIHNFVDISKSNNDDFLTLLLSVYNKLTEFFDNSNNINNSTKLQYKPLKKKRKL